MELPKIQDADVKDKKVFLRADLDVPLEVKGKPPETSLAKGGRIEVSIEDDTRLQSALPTIEHLLNNGATVIIAGHLGRPDQESAAGGEPRQRRGIRNQELSLRPIAEWFAKNFMIHDSKFMLQEKKVGDFDGWKLSDNFFLLENLRFYEGEETNNLEFAQKLATLADIYVDDAFTVVHRNHASVVAITKFLPHFAGLHLQKEVAVLSSILKDPKRPLVVIIGGAKLETKLPLVIKMHDFADYVLVGGKLPLEHEVFSLADRKLLIAKLSQDETDITRESVAKFLEIIDKAATIIWNGPMGLIKEDTIDTEKGTREVAEAIAKSQAYKIVGGGDTLGYLQKLGLTQKFDFVSTGGGAMLAFLSGEKLPGLEVLTA